MRDRQHLQTDQTFNGMKREDPTLMQEEMLRLKSLFAVIFQFLMTSLGINKSHVWNQSKQHFSVIKIQSPVLEQTRSLGQNQIINFSFARGKNKPVLQKYLQLGACFFFFPLCTQWPERWKEGSEPNQNMSMVFHKLNWFLNVAAEKLQSHNSALCLPSVHIPYNVKNDMIYYLHIKNKQIWLQRLNKILTGSARYLEIQALELALCILQSFFSIHIFKPPVFQDLSWKIFPTV